MTTPTKRQIAARHARRLRTIRASLLQMAEQWADVDEYCISELTRLADQAQIVADNLLDQDDT